MVRLDVVVRRDVVVPSGVTGVVRQTVCRPTLSLPFFIDFAKHGLSHSAFISCDHRAACGKSVALEWCGNSIGLPVRFELRESLLLFLFVFSVPRGEFKRNEAATSASEGRWLLLDRGGATR